jgi:hypothetical protein
MGGSCATNGERRGAYGVCVRKPEEGRKPLGRPSCRWDDKWIFRKWDWRWSGLIWFRIGKIGGLL